MCARARILSQSGALVAAFYVGLLRVLRDQRRR